MIVNFDVLLYILQYTFYFFRYEKTNFLSRLFTNSRADHLPDKVAVKEIEGDIGKVI